MDDQEMRLATQRVVDGQVCGSSAGSTPDPEGQMRLSAAAAVLHQQQSCPGSAPCSQPGSSRTSPAEHAGLWLDLTLKTMSLGTGIAYQDCRPNHLPKFFYTNNSMQYGQLSGEITSILTIFRVTEISFQP